jgi:hypothetical protein
MRNTVDITSERDPDEGRELPSITRILSRFYTTNIGKIGPNFRKILLIANIGLQQSNKKLGNIGTSALNISCYFADNPELITLPL